MQLRAPARPRTHLEKEVQRLIANEQGSGADRWRAFGAVRWEGLGEPASVLDWFERSSSEEHDARVQAAIDRTIVASQNRMELFCDFREPEPPYDAGDGWMARVAGRLCSMPELPVGARLYASPTSVGLGSVKLASMRGRLCRTPIVASARIKRHYGVPYAFGNPNSTVLMLEVASPGVRAIAVGSSTGHADHGYAILGPPPLMVDLVDSRVVEIEKAKISAGPWFVVHAKVHAFDGRSAEAERDGLDGGD